MLKQSVGHNSTDCINKGEQSFLYETRGLKLIYIAVSFIMIFQDLKKLLTPYIVVNCNSIALQIATVYCLQRL